MAGIILDETGKHSMVDNYGADLSMGDKVAIMTGRGQYDGVIVGTIDRQTAKTIGVSSKLKPTGWSSYASLHKKDSHRVVKL